MIFLKGIIIGLIFGIPIGAVGTLTIKRTIEYGFKAGFISGLGCSLADLCYCAVSVFGLTIISDFLLKYQKAICILGGIAVIIIGISVIKKKSPADVKQSNSTRLLSFFSSSFAIAITNPATIITFMLAFSVFNIGNITSVMQGVCLSAGILSGTLIWWSVLSISFSYIRKHISQKTFRLINYVLGGLVTVFGLTIIINVFNN